MSFCPYCGNKLKENEQCTCKGAQEDVKAGASANTTVAASKKFKKLLIPAAIVLALIIGAVCIVSYIQSGLDLADYIVIEGVEGLNTQGVLKYSLDENALFAAMMDDTSIEDMNDDNYQSIMADNIAQYEEVSNALECITLTATPETGLSNGDKVTVSATFNNDKNYNFSYHFKDASLDYTVDGLEEGKTFDPFAEENVKVTFSGFSGNGTAEYEVISTDEIFDFVSYTLSQTNGLSNGDEVVLSLKYNAEFFQEVGYFAPEHTEMAFEVNGLSEYFDPLQGIPVGDMDELRKLAIVEANNKLDSYADDERVLDPECVAAFFLKANDYSSPHRDYFNGVDISNAIVVVTHSSVMTGLFHDRLDENWYVHLFPDCYLDDAGHIAYNTESVITYNTTASSMDEIPDWISSEFWDMAVSKIEE